MFAPAGGSYRKDVHIFSSLSVSWMPALFREFRTVPGQSFSRTTRAGRLGPETMSGK